MLLRTLLCLLVAVAGACSDDHAGTAPVDGGVQPDSNAPDAPPDPPVTAYCRALSTVICGGLSSCGCRFDTRAYDAAECVDARTTACVEATSPQAADVAAGRAQIDESALDRCVTALQAKAAACDAMTLPDACRDVLVSTAAIGGTCELAGGGLAFCASGDGVCGPGDECVALPTSGQACLGEVLCGRDLVCVEGMCAARGSANAACQPGTCAEGLVCGTGATCVVPVALDGACQSDEQCAEGLHCVYEGETATCQAATAQGAACTGPGQCGAERSCVPAPETRTCTAPDSSGEMCETDSCGDDLTCSSADMTCVALPGLGQPCLDNQCADGLTCGDGTNECIALGGLHEPCAMGTRFCIDGLGCDQETFTCETPPGAGEPCLLNPPDYVCATGFGCDFDAGSTCVALGAAGTSCTTDRSCVASTYCEASTNQCTPRLPTGSVCEDGNECAVGDECALVAGAYVCRTLPTSGQSCLYDCANGLACKGAGGTCAPALCATP